MNRTFNYLLVFFAVLIALCFVIPLPSQSPIAAQGGDPRNTRVYTDIPATVGTAVFTDIPGPTIEGSPCLCPNPVTPLGNIRSK